MSHIKPKSRKYTPAEQAEADAKRIVPLGTNRTPDEWQRRIAMLLSPLYYRIEYLEKEVAKLQAAGQDQETKTTTDHVEPETN